MKDTTLERAKNWLNPSIYDSDTREEVKRLMLFPKQLEEAFSSDLLFGTGGLRALMGVGTSRLNLYTIRRITQGLANYIDYQGVAEKGVVIGFDSRHHSREFVVAAAEVLLGNQIKVFFIGELRPTPYISFACRHFKAQAAIMITASHNPKEYNGYKVYWEDGAQVVFPHDQGIMKEIEGVDSQEKVKRALLERPEFMRADLEPLDEAYLSAIEGAFRGIVSGKFSKDLRICYTSLHGTGITLLPQALDRFHFSQVHLVLEQMKPDGDFPTVECPNPEYPETLKLGLEELKNSKSEVLLATDPDADRLAVAVMDRGLPVILDGHQLAAIGAYYICKKLEKEKTIPIRPAIVSTIVTTRLVSKIADAFKIHYIDVLTGFKYIGEKIHQWELDPKGYHCIFGTEESYGYLIGSYARDKDGIGAACLFAHIAAELKADGLTLVQLIHEIYKKFGVYSQRQLSFNVTIEKGRDIMNSLRAKIPSSFGNYGVIRVEDYLNSALTGLPKADVLSFYLEGNRQLIFRPSGTEPKLKMYLAVHAETFSSVEEGIAVCEKNLTDLSEIVGNILRTY